MNPEPPNPKSIHYAICNVCGADDCRYDDISPTCPSGHRWDITSHVFGEKKEGKDSP